MRDGEPTPEIGKPDGLRVHTFELEGARYALIRCEPARLGWPAGLTSAEREICELLTGGASNADIASTRGTSTRTVANQVSRVLEKLGVARRDEIVRALLEAGRDGTKE